MGPEGAHRERRVRVAQPSSLVPHTIWQLLVSLLVRRVRSPFPMLTVVSDRLPAGWAVVGGWRLINQQARRAAVQKVCSQPAANRVAVQNVGDRHR